ncbi:hypothetical protein XBKB1_1900002 [Xenorhabdus bovienii str. kraussei Becker Underwood]|uniref:Uncharacterized protein n=1 Tax=Xenorhabdus bovienii str. kraussei Becker Underwood TaxID=1398204 RepID=A0A077PH10_XENBV|nr:hypothetical protein XBKB1_1900002 [Xenorhabdus bovienii str. kraussei Becker Underwood]
MIVDISSRKVVDYKVHEAESGELAVWLVQHGLEGRMLA